MEIKFVFKLALALLMIFAGSWHFVKPEFYIKMVPPLLPNPRLLVQISGVFEILGGLGLLIPATSIFSAWGLIALFIAVFPANLYMAFNGIAYDSSHPAWVVWVRLPFQLVFIAWAYRLTR
jgi:uncharacterized membrane protein